MKERVGCVCENGEVGQSRHILFLSVLSISIFLTKSRLMYSRTSLRLQATLFCCCC